MATKVKAGSELKDTERKVAGLRVKDQCNPSPVFLVQTQTIST